MTFGNNFVYRAEIFVIFLNKAIDNVKRCFSYLFRVMD